MNLLKHTGSRSRFAAQWSRLYSHLTVAALLCAGSASAVNITTQHFDNNRSGLNNTETTLTPSNVNQNSFGKLFEKSVDGDMYGQPLYLQGLTIGGGAHNVVFVTTANNSVYAFDADNGGAAAYWSRNLATAVPAGDVQCCCTDVSTVIGIIGTGVIDTSTNTWYVVDKQKNADASYHYFLHALDVTNGNEKFSGPVEISGSSGGVNFDPKLNNQRSALLLQGGNVYFGFSSHNDCGNYHGFVFAYSASNLTKQATWVATTSSGAKGGIWMAGAGLVGDGTSIYFTTGNGNFNLNTGGNDASMSFVKLSGALARQDYFTPANWSNWSNADLDLGGGGIMLIPGTQRLIGGGKPGVFHLVDTTAMGGFNASSDACIQSFMVTDPNQSLNHLHHGPAFWNNNIYIGGESDYLKAYTWNGTTLNTTPASKTSFTDVLGSMPGWQVTVSSNGNSNAVVWATRCSSGNANNATQPGIVHAFDATNLATELWNSNQNSSRDNVGNFAKNPAPVVANGKLYVPTFSNKLVVYGALAPSNETDTTDPQTGTITAQGDNSANGEGVAQAFDNNSATKWLDFANANPTTRASWIQYIYPGTETEVVTKYTVTSANDAPERDPMNWRFFGIDGSGNATLLDTKTNQSFANRFQKNSYTFTNATAYRGYKFMIDSVANPSIANSVQLSELEFIKVNNTQMFEAESLIITAQTQTVDQLTGDPALSNSAGVILRAVGVNDSVAFKIPNIAAGTYTIHVGVKDGNGRGQFQLAGSRYDTDTWSNIGSPIDEYNATNYVYTDVVVGTWSPGSTSDKRFRFTVTGKNAAANQYWIALDYITLVKQ